MNAVTKEEQTALTLPPAQRAAVVLKSEQTRKDLAVLVKRSAGILTVTNKAGRDEAHSAGMVLKNTRVAIEATGKMAREDATAFSKAVIAEQKALVDLITPEEERVLSLRDQFDHAERVRKDALIAAERARTEAIATAIQQIRDIPLMAVGKSSESISAMIGGLVSREPDESFEEFIEQAKVARHEALDKLAKMETAQQAIEIEAESQRQEAARQALAAEDARKAEALRIEQERAALAAQRAEQAATAQRLAAQEAEARRVQEQAAANLRAEREALAERERLADEAQVKATADLKAAIEVHALEVAAHAAKLRVDIDHAEALEINALVDAAAVRMDASAGVPFASEADLARCTATVQVMLTNGPRLPRPESFSEHDAMIDANFDQGEVTDEELITMGSEWGMSLPEWVERLEKFCVHARAELMVAAQWMTFAPSPFGLSLSEAASHATQRRPIRTKTSLFLLPRAIS